MFAKWQGRRRWNNSFMIYSEQKLTKCKSFPSSSPLSLYSVKREMFKMQQCLLQFKFSFPFERAIITSAKWHSCYCRHETIIRFCTTRRSTKIFFFNWFDFLLPFSVCIFSWYWRDWKNRRKSNSRQWQRLELIWLHKKNSYALCFC